MIDLNQTYTAFAGTQQIVSADLKTMLLKTKEFLDENGEKAVLIFDDQNGRQIDFDFRGTAKDVLDRVEGLKRQTGPGRPKLGVVSREVTLLPRHWDWLEQQPNGISAAIRRLVDESRRSDPQAELARRARQAASKFMWSMTGNLPGYEEASRALFANDQAKFEQSIQQWPTDIRQHLERLLPETIWSEKFSSEPGTRSVEA